MKIRCMLCGRIFEVEEIIPDLEDEDLDLKKKSSFQICQFCQAKLKHEADESQKTPKPI